MNLTAKEPLEAEVLTSTQEFAALETEWEELLEKAPLATPFQSWAWLYSWWEYYGEDYELKLITVRDREGLLVGVLPLMLDRSLGFRRLLFVGTGLTDYLDMLVREGWEQAVYEVGMQALRHIDSWRVADLQQLRPEAAAWGLLPSWPGPQVRLWQDGSPVVDVKPWDELLASLSKNLRSTVRRAIRRAEADGVHPELADPETAEQAARRLVALHRESRQGRKIGAEHLTDRFESCIATAARRMSARNLGGVSEFWRNGEVVISDFWVFKHDFFGTYVLGASQDALQLYQWSSLYIWDAMNIANDKNAPRLNLLRGEEQYKLRWASTIVPSYRLVLGRSSSARFVSYAGYRTLHSKATRYIRSSDAPEYVKSAVAKYRRLRRYLLR